MKSEVFNIDCMIGMKEYPDNYFDLAVVDPFYGIKEDGHRENQTRSKLAQSKKYHSALWDQDPPDKKYFIELNRVSINQIIFGANHFGYMPPSPCWLVWNKKNGVNHFADSELAWTSFKTAVRAFDFVWQGMLQGDMKNKEHRIHPTQKPVKLYEWIFKNYAEEGQKILDTHLGSGSSRIAAYNYKMNFTGYEIDKDYFEAAEKRYQNHIAQLNIFQ